MKPSNGFQRATALICCGFFFAVLVSAFAGEVVQHLTERKQALQPTQNYSAAADYPFDEPVNTAPKEPLPVTRKEKILALEQKFTNSFTTDYFARLPFAVSKKYFEKIMGFNATTAKSRTTNNTDSYEDVILTLADGKLSFICDDVDIASPLQALVAFGEEMQQQGRHFLFFETPFKAGTIDPAYRGIYTDYSDKLLATVMQELQAHQLNGFSVTEYYREHGIDKSSQFFATDHHWLPQSALAASRLFSEQLNERCGYTVDLAMFDPALYHVTDTEPLFLGSQGRSVTGAYCQTEAVSLITPRYDTELEVFVSGKNAVVRGTVEETLMDYTALDDSLAHRYGNFPYNVYGNAEQVLMQIHNLKRHDGKRLLVLKTSFFNAMLPSLTNAAEYVDVIDLRLFDGSLMKYIEQNNPDTIAVVYGMSTFQDQSWPLDSIHSTFNFR